VLARLQSLELYLSFLELLSRVISNSHTVACFLAGHSAFYFRSLDGFLLPDKLRFLFFQLGSILRAPQRA
jgi:hypothetical protein